MGWRVLLTARRYHLSCVTWLGYVLRLTRLASHRWRRLSHILLRRWLSRCWRVLRVAWLRRRVGRLWGITRRRILIRGRASRTLHVDDGRGLGGRRLLGRGIRVLLHLLLHVRAYLLGIVRHLVASRRWVLSRRVLGRRVLPRSGHWVSHTSRSTWHLRLVRSVLCLDSESACSASFVEKLH